MNRRNFIKNLGLGSVLPLLFGFIGFNKGHEHKKDKPDLSDSQKQRPPSTATLCCLCERCEGTYEIKNGPIKCPICGSGDFVVQHINVYIQQTCLLPDCFPCISHLQDGNRFYRS